MTPSPKVAPRKPVTRTATALYEHVSSSLRSLCRNRTSNASSSHLHLREDGTHPHVATELPTSYRRTESRKRPTTPSCRRPFGETPKNNERRRYAGRGLFSRQSGPIRRSRPLWPLCVTVLFPVEFIMHKCRSKCKSFSFRNVRIISHVSHLMSHGVKEPGWGLPLTPDVWGPCRSMNRTSSRSTAPSVSARPRSGS